MKDVLVIVAKRPAPGQTKTRLCPPLSPMEAAELYERFLRDTLSVARSVPAVDRMVAYTPDEAEGYFREVAPDFHLAPQVGGDLAERLDHILTHCLRRGWERVLAMGSDIPTLPAAYAVRALRALDHYDMALGPCDDGGYYAISVKRPAPHLFTGLRMSTDAVLRDTMVRAREADWSVFLLPAWYDVDTPADLARLRAELAALPPDQAPHTREFFARRPNRG